MLGRYGPEKTFEYARSKAREYSYNLRDQGRISFSNSVDGDIPSLHIHERTVPEVFETAFMALLGIGKPRHTHYDPGFGKSAYESFPSLEATTMIHIDEPRGEPRFHMHFLTQQFGDYRAEMEGIKDGWVLDPSEVVRTLKDGNTDKIENLQKHTGWLYSYSQRFRDYPFIDIDAKPQTINQMQSIIDNLTRNPTSRSAQMITWDPRFDHNDGQMKYRGFPEGDVNELKFEEYHAPCLQRVWARLMLSEKGELVLNSNTHWRSRDHLKAVPHNIYGMTEGIIEPLRKGLEESIGEPVKMGRYVDISDSLHLYGYYFDPRVQGKDAESYLEDVYRIANGEPIETRLVLPNTSIHEMIMEEIETEYQERRANPNKGLSK